MGLSRTKVQAKYHHACDYSADEFDFNSQFSDELHAGEKRMQKEIAELKVQLASLKAPGENPKGFPKKTKSNNMIQIFSYLFVL